MKVEQGTSDVLSCDVFPLRLKSCEYDVWRADLARPRDGEKHVIYTTHLCSLERVQCTTPKVISAVRLDFEGISVDWKRFG
jgi:hypothetical protein